MKAPSWARCSCAARCVLDRCRSIDASAHGDIKALVCLPPKCYPYRSLLGAQFNISPGDFLRLVCSFPCVRGCGVRHSSCWIRCTARESRFEQRNGKPRRLQVLALERLFVFLDVGDCSLQHPPHVWGEHRLLRIELHRELLHPPDLHARVLHTTRPPWLSTAHRSWLFTWVSIYGSCGDINLSTASGRLGPKCFNQASQT